MMTLSTPTTDQAVLFDPQDSECYQCKLDKQSIYLFKGYRPALTDDGEPDPTLEATHAGFSFIVSRVWGWGVGVRGSGVRC